MRQSIARLRELTETLPDFPDEVAIPHAPGTKHHKMLRGSSFARDLLSQPEVSCAAWFNSAGTRFPLHVHTQREWLIVYSGSMFFEEEDQDAERLLPGMFVCIEPGTPHQAHFTEDTWYLAITVPQNKNWPDHDG